MRNKWVLAIFFGLGFIGAMWLWAVLFYALGRIGPDAARPWSMPIIIQDYWDIARYKKRILLSGFGVLAGLFAILVSYLYYKPKKTLGDARFAHEGEIKQAGLRASTGLILGKIRGKYLTDDGQTHVLVAAPTGSGKGVGIVIPNLLNWNGSAVVLDIKGENHTLTSGFREKHGQQIIKFSPFSDRSHRFNPFDAINPDPRYRFNDIQNIAITILPDNDKDPTWSQQGRALFTAFALYLLDKPEQVCTIGNILRFLQTSDDTRDVVRAIIEAEGDKLDPAAQRTFANLSQQEKRMSESVKIGLVGALSLWNSASVDAATSATDFDITKLRERKTTIYVVVSLADLTSLRPLLRLFFEQIFAAQLRKEPGPDDKHKVLFLLDEFESLGTMDSIVDKLPFVRSFGIRMIAIIQGLSQLDQRYTPAGRDKILQGSKHQIFFASNDQQTTQYVSDTLGKKTIRTVSSSHGRQGRTVSRQQHARELMLPQEVRELPSGKLILITEGTRPIKANKIKYYQDSAMKKRTSIPPTKAPKLDLSPSFAPTLEEIAGGELAGTIRSQSQPGQQKTQKTKPEAKTTAYTGMIGDVDNDDNPPYLDGNLKPNNFK